MTRLISWSRPITGSSLPSRAYFVRSLLYFSSAPYLLSAVGESTAGAAAHVLERAVDALLVDLELAQHARRVAVALVGDGDEQVLDADVLVLQALGLGVRGLEHLDDARGGVDLHDVVGELRRLRERVGDARREGADVDVHGGEDAAGESVVMLEQREEDVLDVPLGVALRAHHLLGGCEHFLCLLGESILSHHVLCPFSLAGWVAVVTVSR